MLNAASCRISLSMSSSITCSTGGLAVLKDRQVAPAVWCQFI